MKEKEQGITVMDLFCGAGGFSEGFHQAGFDIVFSIDNWIDACETHEINGLGETSNIDLLEADLDEVLRIKEYITEKYGEIDIIIGSPPCTEFSYSKKGGKGDIEKGMILIRRMLLFIAVFRPKFWIMENSPNLEKALDGECKGSKKEGWRVEYPIIGIEKNRLNELGLKNNTLDIPICAILTASDFGSIQNRKRFIAGDFPIDTLNQMMVEREIKLGTLMDKLKKETNNKKPNEFATDPNYHYQKIKISDIRDLDYDTSLHPMYWEGLRHLKRRHIQYGKMSLPENLDLPARTVVAFYNSSSRESLVFGTNEKMIYHGKKRRIFRQPTVREVACMQGFPLDFQLKAKKINQRYKLIGNAVPCQLAFHLAKSITEHINKDQGKKLSKDFIKRYENTIKKQTDNSNRPILTKPLTIVDEAEDIGKINGYFKASETKKIRRKILSSKLYDDSSVVIFDNAHQQDGKKIGGIFWKCCVQKGIGKKYHQIFFDEKSIDIILKAFEKSRFLSQKKDILKNLFKEIEKGIPTVKDNWDEFTGWSGDLDSYIKATTTKYLRIPNVKKFQYFFTTEEEEINDYISPIDFFDGIDAIMIKNFNKKRFKFLIDTMVFFDELKDLDTYAYRKDKRIYPNIKSKSIPFVTIMSGLLSTHILTKMYDKVPDLKNDRYYKSIKKADKVMEKWCSFTK